MPPSTGTPRPLRFATFELDVRTRELRQGDRRIPLQDQPFEVLRTMLERPGEIVTREELQRRLWPDGTFVDFEHGLNAAVKRLRAALGDTADNPRFVETLPRRGYRFIAKLDGGSGPQVRLVVLPFANLSGDAAQDYFSTARLIEAANETRLWSELYDRDLSQCGLPTGRWSLAVQTEVASRVAGALAFELMPSRSATASL